MSADGCDIDFTRYGVKDNPDALQVGFFLPDTFAMLPFISALESLRVANRLSGQALYNWTLMGTGASHAYACNAMPFALEHSIFDTFKLDRLIVCGPHEPHLYDEPKVLRALRRWAGQGTQMGSLDSGSHMLAQADLIKQRRCAIHWENLPGFREAFPGLAVTSELYEIDDELFTCAGGTAVLDMMCELVIRDHGQELAGRLSELFISAGQRAATDPQRRSIVERSGIYHPGLVSCIELMESNVEQPLTTSELAGMVNVSKRQLERLFRTYLDTTPTLYYQHLRLQAGYELLKQTTMSVLEVAAATGFSSSDYFSRRFRVQFGISPTEARRRLADGRRP